MIDLQKAYISQAIYVAANELDKRIRYKQEAAEEAFGSFISAQSQQTNIPDDFDPTQPRLIFQSAHKQMVVSQVACQLSLGFESASKSIDAQIGIIFKNIEECHKKIVQFRGQETLKENALVIVLSIPSDGTREEISEFVYSRFIKMPRFSQIASSSAKVGYLLDNGVFLNIEADVYEKRGGTVQATAGSTFDLNTLPILEMGVSIKVDINTKPRAVEDGYINDGPSEIISLMKEYFPGKVISLLEQA
ncbi:hypothetical protein [Pseudomonas syringae]|uniref:hypothetical protein n=1 Tax=Pseudomonas syringae TaxID=317 RepID=UPI003204B3A2